MSRESRWAERCREAEGALRDVTGLTAGSEETHTLRVHMRQTHIRWERGSCAYVPGSACTRALRETACAEKTDAYAEERHVREQRHAYAEERHVREQRHVRSEDTHAVNPIR